MSITEKLYQHRTPKPELVEFLKLDPEMTKTRPAHGGHMAYNRYFIVDEASEYFVKAHDPSKFTDKKREANSLQYLDKEAAYMRYIQEVAGQTVPQVYGVIEGALVLESLSEENGWYWRAPEDGEQKQAYIEEVLHALRSVEAVDVIGDKLSDTRPALDIFLKDGWKIFDSKKAKMTKKAAAWRDRLSSDNRQYFGHFINDMLTIDSKMVAQNLAETEKNKTLSHHDARQANIAWHPDHGTRIVDWSWADEGTEKADTTMFLIDLAKSGHDVSDYMGEYFDTDHAVLLMGYYASRSLDDAYDGNDTVRFHQFASAITTYRLLMEKTP